MKRKFILTIVLAALACGALSAQITPGISLFAEGGDGAVKPKNAVLPVVLNLLPGCGVGSFVEGDPLGGFICLGGDLAGIGLAGYGAVVVAANVLGAAVGSAMVAVFTLGYGQADTSPMAQEAQRGMTFVIVGACVWAASKVFGIVRPILFAADYNKRHELATLGFAPILRPTSDSGLIRVEPGLAIKLSY